MKGYNNYLIVCILTQIILPPVQSFTASSMIEQHTNHFIRQHQQQQQQLTVTSSVMESKWTMMPDEPAPEVRTNKKKTVVKISCEYVTFCHYFPRNSLCPSSYLSDL
jgi:hypothetical protein